jgi:hypothetical protein
VQHDRAANDLAIKLTLDCDAGGVDLALDFAGGLDDDFSGVNASFDTAAQFGGAGK